MLGYAEWKAFASGNFCLLLHPGKSKITRRPHRPSRKIFFSPPSPRKKILSFLLPNPNPMPVKIKFDAYAIQIPLARNSNSISMESEPPLSLFLNTWLVVLYKYPFLPSPHLLLIVFSYKNKNKNKAPLVPATLSGGESPAPANPPPPIITYFYIKMLSDRPCLPVLAGLILTFCYKILLFNILFKV